MASITASSVAARAVAGRKTFLSGNARVSAAAPKHAMKARFAVRAADEVRPRSPSRPENRASTARRPRAPGPRSPDETRDPPSGSRETPARDPRGRDARPGASSRASRERRMRDDATQNRIEHISPRRSASTVAASNRSRSTPIGLPSNHPLRPPRPSAPSI
jgi:hypothetical protein